MFSCITCYLLLAGIAYIGYKFITRKLAQRKLDRWAKTPKDVVILHGMPRSKTIPAVSPFVLKLETYLRMANIKYEYDTKDTFGPKGKTPWISMNGEHVADTQLIIDFLEKKFDPLENNYSEEQLAVATLVRVTIEEHAFWGAALWAFVFDSTCQVAKLLNLPKWLIALVIGRKIRKQTWEHGIGRHSEEDIQKLTFKDFRSISKLLGNNKFFLGNEPCSVDATIFGFLAQTQWGLLQNSPYQKLVNDELKNLKEYSVRMKEKYWPDWDNVCAS